MTSTTEYHTMSTEADSAVLWLAEHNVPAFVDLSSGETRLRVLESWVDIHTGQRGSDYVTIEATMSAAREWMGY